MKRTENSLSLYSRAHVGSCKRCCPIAKKEISALKLLIDCKSWPMCFGPEKYPPEE